MLSFSRSWSTSALGAFAKKPLFASLPFALAISLSTFSSSAFSLITSFSRSTSSPSGTKSEVLALANASTIEQAFLALAEGEEGKNE